MVSGVLPWVRAPRVRLLAKHPVGRLALYSGLLLLAVAAAVLLFEHDVPSPGELDVHSRQHVATAEAVSGLEANQNLYYMVASNAKLVEERAKYKVKLLHLIGKLYSKRKAKAKALVTLFGLLHKESRRLSEAGDWAGLEAWVDRRVPSTLGYEWGGYNAVKEEVLNSAGAATFHLKESRELQVLHRYRRHRPLPGAPASEAEDVNALLLGLDALLEGRAARERPRRAPLDDALNHPCAAFEPPACLPRGECSLVGRLEVQGGAQASLTEVMWTLHGAWMQEALLVSPAFNVSGYTWHLVLFRNMHNTDSEAAQWVGQYVYCANSVGWSRDLQYSFVTLSQLPDRPSSRIEHRDTIHAGDTRMWGRQHALHVKQLHNPALGLVVGNSMRMAVKLSVTPHIPVDEEGVQEEGWLVQAVRGWLTAGATLLLSTAAQLHITFWLCFKPLVEYLSRDAVPQGQALVSAAIARVQHMARTRLGLQADVGMLSLAALGSVASTIGGLLLGRWLLRCGGSPAAQPRGAQAASVARRGAKSSEGKRKGAEKKGSKARQSKAVTATATTLPARSLVEARVEVTREAADRRPVGGKEPGPAAAAAAAVAAAAAAAAAGRASKPSKDAERGQNMPSAAPTLPVPKAHAAKTLAAPVPGKASAATKDHKSAKKLVAAAAASAGAKRGVWFHTQHAAPTRDLKSAAPVKHDVPLKQQPQGSGKARQAKKRAAAAAATLAAVQPPPPCNTSVFAAAAPKSYKAALSGAAGEHATPDPPQQEPPEFKPFALFDTSHQFHPHSVDNHGSYLFSGLLNALPTPLAPMSHLGTGSSASLSNGALGSGSSATQDPWRLPSPPPQPTVPARGADSFTYALQLPTHAHAAAPSAGGWDGLQWGAAPGRPLLQAPAPAAAQTGGTGSLNPYAQPWMPGQALPRQGSGTLSGDSSEAWASLPPSIGEPAGAGETQCIMCFDRERSATLAPCGHRAMCAACTKQLLLAGRGAGAQALCPICREAVESYIVRVFNV